jgi:hypothetical protein
VSVTFGAGCRVSTFSGSAFDYRASLRSIRIPVSVEPIGQWLRVAYSGFHPSIPVAYNGHVAGAHPSIRGDFAFDSWVSLLSIGLPASLRHVTGFGTAGFGDH